MADTVKQDTEEQPRRRGGLAGMLGLGQARKAGEEIRSRASKLESALERDLGVGDQPEDPAKGRKVDFETSYPKEK